MAETERHAAQETQGSVGLQDAGAWPDISAAQDTGEASDDPRPDLTEDHHLWKAVLQRAAAKWRGTDQETVWGLLHGLRCGGSRLRLRNGRLRLQVVSDLAPEETVREQWLMPHKDTIVELFHEIEERLRR